MITHTLNLHHFSLIKTLKGIGNKLHEIEHIPTRHRLMLEARYRTMTSQLITLAFVLAMLVVVIGINMVWKDFFVYPSALWEVPALGDLTNFWPLLLWCGFMTTISSNHVRSSSYDEKLWGTGMLSGSLAGLWEEIGYRYVFICFGMIAVTFSNWLYGTVLVWFFVLMFGIAAIAVFVDDKHNKLMSLVYGTLCITAIYVSGVADPIFWLYQTILIPLLNWVSFGSFANILLTIDAEVPLLLMGAMTANVWFRDGHKYQGPVGWLDSWVVGFVFLYAALTYSLLTAIILHSMWNILVYTSIYAKRKWFG
ncbi:MAG: hypothetical protein ACI9H6_000173 [Patiriisocius sp.]|jgi:hypothetical protein